jgi:cytoskeletal protein CcmA (bactofilin family)
MSIPTLTAVDRLGMRRTAPVVLAGLLAACWIPSPAQAEMKDGSKASYTIEEGATHKGDLYLLSGSVDILGTLDGELTVLVRRLDVSGTVTGNVNAAAQHIVLSGTIQDSVHVAAESVRVSGTIDGDLMAGGASVIVEKGAVIAGNVYAAGARVEIGGIVEQDVDATGGEVVINGVIGGDASLEADIIEISPAARIEGDLDYTSRNRLQLEGLETIEGDIEYTHDEYEPPVTTSGLFSWFFWLLTALIIGLASIALLPRRMAAIVGKVGEDGLRSAGVGFITAIVVPVASCILCFLVITIPLVVIACIVFLILVYLARIPVAIWLGDLILRRVGRRSPSPYLALTVGIPVLYLLFAIPFLWGVAYLATIFIGLGAMVLCAWEVHQARSRPGDQSPASPAPGGVAGLPPAPTPSPGA